MESGYLKNSIEKSFAENLEPLKIAYLENAKVNLFVKKGKDDLKGRCLMINLVSGSDFWLASPSVKVTLWQDDDELKFKDEIVELMIALAKENGLSNIKVQSEN